MPLSKLDAPPEPVRPSLEEPGADVTTEGGPRLPKDVLGHRLLLAGIVSVLVNMMIWSVASRVVRNHIPAPPVPIVFKRIILPPKLKPHQKIVHKIVRLKPKPRPFVKPKTVAPPRPVIRPLPAPPAAHHRILTAKGMTPTHMTTLPGGHAKLGQPINHQNVGEGNTNDQKPSPQPQSGPETTPQPQPKPAPQPEAKSQPLPQPQPQPAGPTQDAKPSNQVNPDIPDELKTGDYKSSIRVKVDVQADGSFEVSLVTSSGNGEIDRRVLEALKRWRWKPALDNGRPTHSTQRFRFNFEVQ